MVEVDHTPGMKSQGAKHLERRKRRAARAEARGGARTKARTKARTGARTPGKKKKSTSPIKRRRSSRERLLSAFVYAGLSLAILTTLLVLPLRWLSPPTSSFILQRHFSAESKGAGEPRYRWRDRKQISRSLAAAVQASEDQKFREHFGFDFKSIASAFEERGKRVRGASTISQQVAKNLYLWPGKSLVRKGLEAYLTLALELFLPKDRILEIYLNVAEFGPNVFGAEAASQYHFGKPASRLTKEESALFAAVLPNPAKLSASRPSEYVLERATQIREDMERF